MSSELESKASPHPRSRCAPGRRVRSLLAAAAGSSLFCGSLALADNYTWTGLAGAQAFTTGANWSPSGPPGAFDVAVFGQNQANTVIFDSDQTNISLEVLQGSITLSPDVGATPLTRTYSLGIDSYINGGTLTVAGLAGPPSRQMQVNMGESLYVGGDFFSGGSLSTLALSAGSAMNVASNLKLWDAGTLNLSGGALTVGTFDHTSGGTFSFTGGSLHAGTFLGNLVTQGGTIAPGNSVGLTRINGNLQMDSGAIEVEVSGFNPGVDYDRVEVTGSASFGTSNVVMKTLNGFTPLPGDVFEVVTYSSGVGDPTIINETGFAGLTFDPTITPTSLAIRALALFPGDADLNGKVDLYDLVALATHWQSNANWLGGDFDGNGFVDASDLALLAQNWQAGVAALPFDTAATELGLPIGAEVPEPAGSAILVSAALLLRRRRVS